jgi:hypothetical protein
MAEKKKPRGRSGGRRPGPYAPYAQRNVQLSSRAWAFIAAYGLQIGSKSDNETIERIIRSHPLFTPEEDVMSLKSVWIGSEGGAFERVGLAFEALGYQAPRPDAGGSGTYGANIASQYRADMSERDALAVVRWGLRSSKAQLRAAKGNVTLSEIAGMYEQ